MRYFDPGGVLCAPQESLDGRRGCGDEGEGRRRPRTSLSPIWQRHFSRSPLVFRADVKSKPVLAACAGHSRQSRRGEDRPRARSAKQAGTGSRRGSRSGPAAARRRKQGSAAVVPPRSSAHEGRREAVKPRSLPQGRIQEGCIFSRVSISFRTVPVPVLGGNI